LDAKHRLAAMLWSQGEFTEAETMQEEVLGLRRQALGDKDPATLQTMSDLSATKESLGLFKEALALAEEAAAGQAEVVGPRHQATLRSRYLQAKATIGNVMDDHG